MGGRTARQPATPSRLGGLMPGITLDAGALIAIDRNDRRIAVLLARAGETRARITIPGSALAQAIRRPERQVRLARLVRQPTTDVVDLGRVDATNVGRLLAASGTADVVDAHIVVCARRAHQRVVTSDPDDLCLLDPSLDVFTSDPHDHKPAFGSAWAELAPCDEGPPVCPAPRSGVPERPTGR